MLWLGLFAWLATASDAFAQGKVEPMAASSANAAAIDGSPSLLQAQMEELKAQISKLVAKVETVESGAHALRDDSLNVGDGEMEKSDWTEKVTQAKRAKDCRDLWYEWVRKPVAKDFAPLRTQEAFQSQPAGEPMPSDTCKALPTDPPSSANRKSQYETARKEAIVLLDRYAKTLREELDRERAKLASVASKLDKVAKDEVKEKENERLTMQEVVRWTLVAMPIFVLLVFVVSMAFSRSVQEKLFETRTIVEIVGLAALLMTIIVLGVNDRIDKSALSAIVGSIAGYVFGQQLRQAGVQRVGSSIATATQGAIPDNVAERAAAVQPVAPHPSEIGRDSAADEHPRRVMVGAILMVSGVAIFAVGVLFPDGSSSGGAAPSAAPSSIPSAAPTTSVKVGQ